MPFDIRGITRSISTLSLPGAIASIPLFSFLAIIILASLFLAQSRGQHRYRAEIMSQNLCTVLANDLINSYERIDLAVLGVKDMIEEDLASGGINGPRLETLIRRQMERNPVIFALRTANADGIIIHGNGVVPGSRISVTDRDYFIRLKSDKNAGLVFSKPLIGRVTGTWAMILARRINRPDGSFAGVAYGAIKLDNVKSYFASLGIGKQGVISLRDSNLAVIVRQSGNGDPAAQSEISPELRALAETGRTSGTYTAVIPHDRIERITSFVKLQPYGHYLLVGLGTREVFEPWRRELYRTILFVLLFLSLIGASSRMTYNAWIQRRQAEAGREQVISELQKALAEVNTLSGLLPICSNCKKIRDDTGYWSQIEAYISSHSDAQFTHSICPDCMKLLYPDCVDNLERKTGS